jgi:UDP-2,3-diacylglucosamine hydrolase
VQLLADPTVLTFAGQRWLLSHGDALCLGDVDYLAFRAQVRTPDWQRAFLARALAERQAIAQSLRAESEQRKRSGASYADVDRDAALDWLRAAAAPTLVHGHTHRPADHALDAGHRRIVLTDWDLKARPPRAEALRLSTAGVQRVPLA